MPLSIKSDRVDRLARELAALTGETITDAVEAALVDRLERERRARGDTTLDDIVERFGALPVLDPRPADELIGYDDTGLPA